VEFRPFKPDDAEFCFGVRSQAFNQKMGFTPAGQTFCEFNGVKIPALRLCRTLGQ
jgi:hypothetical protein